MPTLKSVDASSVRAYVFDSKDPITAEKAKILLGWQEETKLKKFGNDFLLNDCYGVKIRCLNNLNNRPYYSALAERYAEEMVWRRWQLNGEPIIVDCKNQIVSGQHRLIAIVLADQWRKLKEDAEWQSLWVSCVTFESVVVLGVPAGDLVANTVDCGKRRTTTDALYRTEYLVKYDPKTRRAIARLCDYGLKCLWGRTAIEASYDPSRSHSESIAFLSRHQKLVDAADFIYHEDGSGRISQHFHPGLCTGMLYLFGVSRSDGEVYRSPMNRPRAEAQLDFSLWESSEKFFSTLAQAGKVSMGPLFKECERVKNMEGISPSDTYKAIKVVLVKAWLMFRDGKILLRGGDVGVSIRGGSKNGYEVLENPTVGGIDLGNTTDKRTGLDALEDEDVDSSQDEVAGHS